MLEKVVYGKRDVADLINGKKANSEFRGDAIIPTARDDMVRFVLL
ncbi:hypothetical protein [Pyrococcus kukulkanii]|uniref:Uncharacterized protein n=1 Tax=Pyrococcus kukulkanii TaxID=1609559 RepID=A0ABV4T802_9EURY